MGFFSDLGKGFTDFFAGPSENQKIREFQQQMAEQAEATLDPSNVYQYFDELRGYMSPLLNDILTNANMIGQAGATSAAAGLRRQGLSAGSGTVTGAQSAIRSGARTGGMNARMKALMDIFGLGNQNLGAISRGQFQLAANPGGYPGGEQTGAERTLRTLGNIGAWGAGNFGGGSNALPPANPAEFQRANTQEQQAEDMIPSIWAAFGLQPQ